MVREEDMKDFVERQLSKKRRRADGGGSEVAVNLAPEVSTV